MVFKKIQELICEQLNLSESEINMETSFKDDLNADSLDLFQVIMGIEEEYELEIPGEEIEKMDTVGDVVEFIKEKKDLE